MRKNLILICGLILALLLSACAGPREAAETAAPTTAQNGESLSAESTQPTESDTEAPEPDTLAVEQTEETPEPTAEPADPEAPAEENSAFTQRFGDCDGSLLAAIYNAPFMDGVPSPTVTWNEGEYGRLVIYPRYVGSVVSLYPLEYDGEGQMRQIGEPVYTSVCREGDCIAAALDRPDAAPCWMLMVKSPEGAEAGYPLAYNGRYGTYAYEYLSDPSASSWYPQLPAQEELECFEEVLGKDVLYSFMRAVARREIDPWQAMWDYCTPLTDIGDGAAYTMYSCEMDGDVCRLDTAMLREGYDPAENTREHLSLEERVAGQAALYQQVGNRYGILGLSGEYSETDRPPLVVDLKGLTVYNPTLLAKRVSVQVNGADAGEFDLEEGDFCTLLDMDFNDLPGDQAQHIQVRVIETRGGDPSRAILEVWPGLGGNISGAR